MKIAVIGHIRHPIAEPFQGGMEAHCHQLVRALVDRGHDVTLFAAGHSDLPNMVPICDQPYEAVLPSNDWRGTDRLVDYQDAAFSRAWQEIEPGAFEIVHNNSLYAPLIDWAACDGVPMLTSQHVPPFGTMLQAFVRAKDKEWLHFTLTSQHQAGLWGRIDRGDVHVVHNGIDTARWTMATQRSDRLLWFGRITENKGLREAIQATLLAGAKLDIVGTIEDRTYFDAYVRPNLGATIRYLGHLAGDALRQRVAEACAVLVTPLWDEPFGLVAAEAMSCGVPVIAFDRGAMSEVLGDCGQLVPAGDVDVLAEAIKNAGQLDGAACRQRICQHFSIDRMLLGYEKAYARCLAHRSEPI